MQSSKPKNKGNIPHDKIEFPGFNKLTYVFKSRDISSIGVNFFSDDPAYGNLTSHYIKSFTSNM